MGAESCPTEGQTEASALLFSRTCWADAITGNPLRSIVAGDPHARSWSQMSCILDIDLDYFNLVEAPERRLRELLSWGGRHVSILVEEHHHALREWHRLVARGHLANPDFILHVDEHHDMMDERDRPNIANVMYHAMRRWPTCRLHWITVSPIDSPAMWLSEENWSMMEKRFSVGQKIPANWPKPDLVSVTRSPDFVSDGLANRLRNVINEHGESSNKTLQRKANRRQ